MFVHAVAVVVVPARDHSQQHSQLFQTMSREEPSGNEFTGRTLKPTRSAGAGGLSTMAIEEGDEDEEEDDDE